MRRPTNLLMALLLVGLILVVNGCCTKATPSPTPTSTPSNTPVFKIGDTVASDSLQATVLWLEKMASIKAGNTTVSAGEQYTLLSITVELSNTGGNSTQFNLGIYDSMIWGDHGPVRVTILGALSDGSIQFIRGAIGELRSIHAADSSWTLTRDEGNDLWTVTIMANSTIQLVFVYGVPIDSSGFSLSLLSFPQILLKN